ncbi:MAG: prepilin-type N-terminal cleavage/methylation domain-containing protein [Candidatus Nealsonbacteria bacterium]|nr:prepilin-type N-terminal cleavage/methylation domain-containing protein [Candidatus Nealsonbacteria bacterium]
MIKNMKGFTFIELIIYIAILSVILVLVGNLTWNIIQGNTKNASYREVQQNISFAMEKITKDLRLGSNPNIFSVLDGVLYQNNIPLTTAQVKVINFQITPIANTYKIGLSIEYNNPSNRNEYKAAIVLNSTVTLTAIGSVPSQGCWGIGGSCDPICQHNSYGSLISYYANPGCTSTCPVAGSFYINSGGACSNDGTGSCHKMGNSLTASTSCSQGASCGGTCLGICTPCSGLNQAQCSQQQRCRWFSFSGGRCFGRCTICSNFSDQTFCQNQLGCSWQSTGWNWTLSNSQGGYSSYANCEWYVQ